MTARQQRRMLEGGLWQELVPSAYADAGFVPDARQWAAAVTAACGPGAVAAGRTAARLWGLPLLDDPDDAARRRQDVVVDGRLRARGQLVVHRWALEEQDAVRVGGVAVTSPRRTLRDLARLVAPDALLCAADSAVRAGLTTAPHLLRDAAAHLGRPGCPALHWAAGWADGRAQSPLESLTRICLWSAQLPALTPQLLVRDRDGDVVAALDLGVPALRLGVEADGASYHSSVAARARDSRRSDALERLGYRLVRVSWHDVRHRRAAVRARVARAAREQAARLDVPWPAASPLPAPPTAVWA